jgi:hypothetical protein
MLRQDVQRSMLVRNERDGRGQGAEVVDVGGVGPREKREGRRGGEDEALGKRRN